jgi:hypothetical protein
MIQIYGILPYVLNVFNLKDFILKMQFFNKTNKNRSKNFSFSKMTQIKIFYFEHEEIHCI